MNKQELIDFEQEIADMFLDKQISSPIHLAGCDIEDSLIELFKDIKEDDWVFSTHRSHYHALLKGIPKEELKQIILDGNSMHVNSKKYKFFSSSIVGGGLPIALGVALANKLKGNDEHVWIFVGDMAAEMGVFNECTKYAARNDLPISFIIEDNGLSTETPTQESWGLCKGDPHIIKFTYKRKWPHVGCGKWVTF